MSSYGTSISIELSETRGSFLESYFFKERKYDVRVARTAQKVLSGCLLGVFGVGLILLPWVGDWKEVTARIMVGGMATCGAAMVANYLFYRQVFKPYHADHTFNFIHGPIPVIDHL